MSDTPRNDKSKQIRHLRELIAALDKRVPRIERVGEAEIARDAAELKKKALTSRRAPGRYRTGVNVAPGSQLSECAAGSRHERMKPWLRLEGGLVVAAVILLAPRDGR